MAQIIFNEGTDMSAWDLTAVDDADALVHSSKKLVLDVLSDGGATHTYWTFTGTDFTYDEGGDVSGGIAKHLTLKQVGHPDVDVDISGFSIPLLDIRNFVHANDVAGLQNAFFGGADRFTLNSTESYVLLGLGGNDKFDFGANFSSDDRVDGGLGNDAVTLQGNYGGGVFFTDTTMVNVENIYLLPGFDYFLSLADATVASNGMLTVDGHNVGATNGVTLDASHETDGRVKFTGGAGADGLFGGARNDVLKGGNGSDFIKGALGADQLTGGGGLDYFVYHNAVANMEGQESNSTAFDTIFDFNAAIDLFDVAGKAIAYDGTLAASDLKHLDTFLTSDNFAVDHARLVTFANTDIFVVVNSDGVDGYQAGSDLIVRLDGANHLDQFSSANFATFG
jgi:Ca2+-binding RTX toxin-like protein